MLRGIFLLMHPRFCTCCPCCVWKPLKSQQDQIIRPKSEQSIYPLEADHILDFLIRLLFCTLSQLLTIPIETNRWYFNGLYWESKACDQTQSLLMQMKVNHIVTNLHYCPAAIKHILKTVSTCWKAFTPSVSPKKEKSMMKISVVYQLFFLDINGFK